MKHRVCLLVEGEAAGILGNNSVCNHLVDRSIALFRRRTPVHWSSKATCRAPHTVVLCGLPTIVTACHSHNSLRDPMLLKGHRRRTARGRWVAAQKPSQQHLVGETSLLGDYRSPTAVARAPVTSSRCQAGPRFSLNQGPVHAGVTVAAALSGVRTQAVPVSATKHRLLSSS